MARAPSLTPEREPEPAVVSATSETEPAHEPPTEQMPPVAASPSSGAIDVDADNSSAPQPVQENVQVTEPDTAPWTEDTTISEESAPKSADEAQEAALAGQPEQPTQENEVADEEMNEPAACNERSKRGRLCTSIWRGCRGFDQGTTYRPIHGEGRGVQRYLARFVNPCSSG